MFKKRTVIAITLWFLLNTMLGTITVSLQANHDVESRFPESGNNQQEFGLGYMLGRSLSTECSIFIGTVSEIERREENEKTGNVRSTPYTKIDTRIDEWLWKEPINHGTEYQLYKEFDPYHRSATKGAWENVDLQVNKRLLVVLWEGEAKKQKAHLGKGSEVALIVSQESLFPIIREIIDQHAQYIQSPDNIENASILLNGEGKQIFAGYLITYLYMKPNLKDKEVSVLIELLNNDSAIENGLGSITTALTNALTNTLFPISETTRNSVIEALISAGSSKNLKLAEQALSSLAMVSDSNWSGIKALLNEDKRFKLIENYNRCFGNNTIGGANIYSKFLLQLQRE